MLSITQVSSVFKEHYQLLIPLQKTQNIKMELKVRVFNCTCLLSIIDSS